MTRMGVTPPPPRAGPAPAPIRLLLPRAPIIPTGDITIRSLRLPACVFCVLKLCQCMDIQVEFSFFSEGDNVGARCPLGACSTTRTYGSLAVAVVVPLAVPVTVTSTLSVDAVWLQVSIPSGLRVGFLVLVFEKPNFNLKLNRSSFTITFKFSLHLHDSESESESPEST